jgi:hypothetical protein
MEKRHGGAYDRGSADAYYGRGPSPHKYEGATYSTARVELTDPSEVAAYHKGYDEEDDRKVWD